MSESILITNGSAIFGGGFGKLRAIFFQESVFHSIFAEVRNLQRWSVPEGDDVADRSVDSTSLGAPSVSDNCAPNRV